MTPPPVWRIVPALGITQIVSWGTLYYSIAVLGASMRAELGISSPALFGAYSASLMIGAAVAPAVGRAIDRLGGRRVMSIRSLLPCISLLAISPAPSLIALYAAL